VDFVPKVALFLGAGASRAFGYPTTKEFLENIKKKLTGSEKRLLGVFTSPPQILDIEHVLKAIDALLAADSDPYLHAVFLKSPPTLPSSEKGTTPQADRDGFDIVRTNAITRRRINWVGFVDSCMRLKELIIDELHSEYEFDPTGQKEVLKVYTNMLKSFPMYRNKQLDIFTTNYDRVVEEFCSATGRGIKLIDGFSDDLQRKARFWHPESEFKQTSSPSVRADLVLRLFKLHGSLDWRETHHGKIENVRTEEKCRRSKRYKRNVLIYPTQKGPEAEEPFATLFRYFKDASLGCDSFLVIGFSFRDALINDVFLNFLGRDSRKSMIVVSPHAKENINKNLFADVRREKERMVLERQIHIIPNQFGEDRTSELINKKLTEPV
jgi:hypothetical protein